MGLACCGSDQPVQQETPGQLRNNLEHIEYIANTMNRQQLFLLIKF